MHPYLHHHKLVILLNHQHILNKPSNLWRFEHIIHELVKELKLVDIFLRYQFAEQLVIQMQLFFLFRFVLAQQYPFLIQVLQVLLRFEQALLLQNLIH